MLKKYGFNPISQGVLESVGNRVKNIFPSILDIGPFINVNNSELSLSVCEISAKYVTIF